MVFYFTSEQDGIRFGWPVDLWFHVDNLSSAHVYLRLPAGMTPKQIPAAVLADCAQLVKANSIEGNKKQTGSVRIVYTAWANLYKTRGMADGQVSFKDNKACMYTTVLSRENAIVNRLEKTRVEKPTAYIRESREAYDASERAIVKASKREFAASAQAEKVKHAEDKAARSYDNMHKPEDMISNAEYAASSSSIEDDFM